ncbi:AbrB/MazE/SpoVT family DNA-binding domain-containing protein [Xylophilus sp.]|uniref:AbrB/MazE/SpoVT family DNA-binding domain-containing protein n=1 Tax=Xylophilus sp. TaxID=2653893 RepID=UPI0013B6C814|nr:AbrB/MazE/SpoVT family DNA-binding domain-containing protein [Xylophilus sp.]KAF1046747.1 MAG: hypothetical protein GAK38_02310 [Xylophilus sp.]
MTTATLSPDFHLDLPQDVVQRLGIKPGDTLTIRAVNGRIELTPLPATLAVQEKPTGENTALPDEPGRA